MLTVEEERGTEPDKLDIVDIVDSTLAAVQSQPARRGFLRVAEAVLSRYRETDPAARRRWPRTGASVGSARILDRLAGEVVGLILTRAEAGIDDDLTDPEFLLQVPVVLETLLELSEAPAWRFRTTVRGADIKIDPGAVLRDWLRWR